MAYSCVRAYIHMYISVFLSHWRLRTHEPLEGHLGCSLLGIKRSCFWRLRVFLCGWKWLKRKGQDIKSQPDELAWRFYDSDSYDWHHFYRHQQSLLLIELTISLNSNYLWLVHCLNVPVYPAIHMQPRKRYGNTIQSSAIHYVSAYLFVNVVNVLSFTPRSPAMYCFKWLMQ